MECILAVPVVIVVVVIAVWTATKNKFRQTLALAAFGGVLGLFIAYFLVDKDYIDAGILRTSPEIVRPTPTATTTGGFSPKKQATYDALGPEAQSVYAAQATLVAGANANPFSDMPSASGHADIFIGVFDLVELGFIGLTIGVLLGTIVSLILTIKKIDVGDAI